MIYLFIAISFSAVIGLLFKFSEINGMHRYSITTVNYFTASLISFMLVLKDNLFSSFGPVTWSSFWNEFMSTPTGHTTVLSLQNSCVLAVFMGLITGIFYLNAFIYYQKGINKSGIALSGVFSRLGVLIPTIFAVLIWKELPSYQQLSGIVLAIFSIILINLNFDPTQKGKINTVLLLLFLTTGMGLFGNKIFQRYAVLELKNLYLFFVFFTALILSIRIVRREKQPFLKADIMVGAGVGFFNLFTNFFLILALNEIKASVAFPLFSAGSIILMTLGGLLVFKERLCKKDAVAIGMTIVAIVLINL